ncbi:MAG: YecA family protein [Smithella sp.]
MKIFNAKEKKNLTHALSKTKDPKNELKLEEFHGLLFGIAITPEDILPDEWFPAIFDDNLCFDNEKDAEKCTGYLKEACNKMINDGNKNKLEYPFDYNPNKSEYSLIEDWTHGFFLGLSLRSHIWQMSEELKKADGGKIPPEIQTIKDSYDIISTIAQPEERVGIYEPIPGLPQSSPDEILEMLFIMLPAAVQILKNYGAKLRKEKSGAKASKKKSSESGPAASVIKNKKIQRKN